MNNQRIEQDFYLREETAVGLHEISEKLNIPVQWLAEDAVETLIDSYDSEIRKALREGYAMAVKRAELHDAFDRACEKAIKGLDVIMEYERGGWRYEAIAFKGKKLVVVSGRFPLKRGQKVAPREITLAQSAQWAADRAAEPDGELPDGGGCAANEARWFRQLTAGLGGVR